MQFMCTAVLLQLWLKCAAPCSCREQLAGVVFSNEGSRRSSKPRQRTRGGFESFSLWGSKDLFLLWKQGGKGKLSFASALETGWKGKLSFASALETGWKGQLFSALETG